jgi:hypothetical protein
MEAIWDHGTAGDQGMQPSGSVAVRGRAGSPDSTPAPGTTGQNVRPPWQTNPMEATGGHGTQHSGSVAVLGRAGSRAGAAFQGTCDGGTRLEQQPRQWRLSTAAVAGDAVSVTEPARLTDATEPTDIAALRQALAVVNAAAAAAPEMLAMANYVEAANFAAMAEEVSRTMDYLQVLAAGAVDRTRTRAITEAARSTKSTRLWVTGWDNGTETLTETDANWPAATATGTGTGTTRPVPVSPADDGCRKTEEFLRLRLRIGISEARRRLRLAHDTLPATTLTGDPIPPAREHLALGISPNPSDGMPEDQINGQENTGQEVTGRSLSAPAVSSRAGTIISLTLDRLQHHTTPETLERIEHDLTRTAATADPDFLARVARRWADTIDADGTEPTEEALRHTQGAFIRKPRHGLHHLEIFATTDQYEHLLTVMNTATNPRTTTPADTNIRAVTNTGAAGTGRGTTGPGAGPHQEVWRDGDVDLDRRTRSQKQLDGIIGAVKAALTTNTLPTTGGNRPQIIATINYRDLFPHTSTVTGVSGTGSTGTGTDTDANRTGSTWTGTGTDTGAAGAGGGAGNRSPGGAGTGNFVFTGPVAATTLRKIACDADIIPALLGTHGEILDLGRQTRLFTPAQRIALTARDQGCTFPNCTIPAPWCEAHHITYWSHDGPTDPSNGALLCSHHHHLVHKEQWTIHTRNGVPWYIPPRHIDPAQKPQQNHYFKPPPPPGE